MKNVFLAVITVCCLVSILPANAQKMKSTRWSAFGVSFKIPSDFIIEDDSEEGYILSNDQYYVNVQILDGEAMNKKAIANEVRQVAVDDQLSELSTVKEFSLPKFYGAQLQGSIEGEWYLYNYLMAKDESCGFFVTVIYKDKNDKIPKQILESFELED